MANLSGTRSTAALLRARTVDIATPGNLNLPAVQQSINQIRERFTRLESLVNRLYDLLEKSGGDGSATANSVAAQLSQLAAQIAALENTTSSGTTAAEDEGPPADRFAMAAIAELAKRVDAIEGAPPGDQATRSMINELSQRVSALEEEP